MMFRRRGFEVHTNSVLSRTLDMVIGFVRTGLWSRSHW